MIFLAFVFVAVIVVCTGACFALRSNAPVSVDLLVLPNKSLLRQVLGVTLMTPWAYVGFEAISHGSEEFAFSRNCSKRVLFVVVGTTFVLYVALILLSVSWYPSRYANWFAYLSDLNNLSGLEALPPFCAVNHFLGAPGVTLLMAALFSLIFSSLIGHVLAVSRLVRALARDEVIPPSFAALNGIGAPQRAIVAIVAASMVVPFFGRTAIGWIVDITTIGSVIVYVLACLASAVAARDEGNKRQEVAAAIGVASMGLFGLLSLLPSLFAEGSLAQETYFLVTAWSVIGFAFYKSLLRRDKNMEYGKSIVVWGLLLTLVLFASTVWLQKADQRTMDSAIMDVTAHIAVRDEAQKQYVMERLMEANHSNVHSSILVIGMFALALAGIVNDYRYLRKRQEQSETELGAARQIAYTDPLTGVKSRHALFEWRRRLEDAMPLDDELAFAVVVCDVNDLKQVNDTRGHEVGDQFIRDASHDICVAFKHSPVFRTGGDEFAVLLQGRDYENRHNIVASFNARAELRLGTEDPVVALGISEYDPQIDDAFRAVLDRADANMYARKHELKQLQMMADGIA